MTVNGRPFTSGTIPFGATVDVTSGAAVLKNGTGTLSVTGAEGLPAAFVLKRGTDRGKPILELWLAKGDFSACPKRKTSGVARTVAKVVVNCGLTDMARSGHTASTRRRRSGGRGGHGHRCDGTSTHVTRGVVEVLDIPKNRLVTVRPGGTYLAQP